MLISKKILIIGGGNIGFNLAKNIEETLESNPVIDIQPDPKEEDKISPKSNQTKVIYLLLQDH